MSKWTKMW